MNRLLLLTPLFVIAFSGNSDYSQDCLNLLVNLIHLTTPRPSGLPSPFTLGIMTFYSVLDRYPIRKFTHHKSGIYCWVNNLNGKCYVGKGVDLYLRLSNYYQKAYLERTRNSSLLSKAILKDVIGAFSLIIIEVNPADLSHAEQYWITTLKPEYNTILDVLVTYDPSKQKPNRFGSNNSFFGKAHTEEVKDILRTAALAREKPNRPGFEFIIEDTLQNTSTTHPSIRKGVEFMSWNQPNIMRHLRTSPTKLYLKRYKLVVKREQ